MHQEPKDGKVETRERPWKRVTYVGRGCIVSRKDQEGPTVVSIVIYLRVTLSTTSDSRTFSLSLLVYLYSTCFHPLVFIVSFIGTLSRFD